VRQATVGSTLAALYTRSATRLLRIDVERTGDADFPGWDPVASGVPALVLQLNADQRQRRSEGYSNPVTHECYCDDQPELEIGVRVVETHHRQETGVWAWLPATEQTTYTVLGKQRVEGMPEPHTQVRLDLNQRSPTR
jgi:hypothetical protein